MAVDLVKGENVSIGTLHGCFMTFTGDGSVKYKATGITHALKGAICVNSQDGDSVMPEMNTTNSTTTTNGTIYWPTALGSGVDVTYLVFW